MVIVLILLKQIRQKVRGKSGHRLCSVIMGNKWETWQKMWVCIYSWARASRSQLGWSCWAWSLQQLEKAPAWLPGASKARTQVWQQLPRKRQDPCRGRADPWREPLPALWLLRPLPALSGNLPNHSNGTGPEAQGQSTTRVSGLLVGKCGFGGFGKWKICEVLAKQIYRISDLIHRSNGTLLAKDSGFQVKFHPVSSTRFTRCRSSDLRWSWGRYIPCAVSNICTFHIN